MPIEPDALPDDAATLQQMPRTLLLEHGEPHAENNELQLLVQRPTCYQFGRMSKPGIVLPSTEDKCTTGSRLIVDALHT